jgi:hypothetical protein
MPRLFALDRNFPQPIVDILSDFQADPTLVSLDRIDKRCSVRGGPLTDTGEVGEQWRCRARARSSHNFLPALAGSCVVLSGGCVYAPPGWPCACRAAPQRSDRRCWR